MHYLLYNDYVAMRISYNTARRDLPDIMCIMPEGAAPR